MKGMNQIGNILNTMKSRGKFTMKLLYDQLSKDAETVDWSHIIQHNAARPRAVVCLWLVYHSRLATKSRLKRLGLLQEDSCSLCNEHVEDIDHLLINCSVTKHVWKEVLDWLEVKHKPGQWQEEKKWIVQNTKGKGYHIFLHDENRNCRECVWYMDVSQQERFCFRCQ
ncbi:uncharacterized protein LOC131597679 [Vicia villosa]|uniref:uncharacterized protein LOC131597679 n=1 Tax=Vicia villosa TaxID=3911 RepID=UPI00273C0D8E|nr:uncharacterized protein LOC131597679 [Vicia villosa]